MGITKVFEHLRVMYETIYTVTRQDHHDGIAKIGNQSENIYVCKLEDIYCEYFFITILYITFTRLIIILHRNDLVIRKSVVGVD